MAQTCINIWEYVLLGLKLTYKRLRKGTQFFALVVLKMITIYRIYTLSKIRHKSNDRSARQIAAFSVDYNLSLIVLELNLAEENFRRIQWKCLNSVSMASI